MHLRLALSALALAAPGIVLTFLFEHPFAEVAFALLATLFPVLLMVLGAAREGRLGSVALPLLALVLILLAGVGGMLVLRGRVGESPWLGGLPLAAALQIYLVFAAPLLLVSLAYALSFEEQTLREEDLDALYRVAASHRKAGKAGEG